MSACWWLRPVAYLFQVYTYRKLSGRRGGPGDRLIGAPGTRLGSTAMTDTHRGHGFATRAIHAGFRPDPATGAVNAPIYASSTFAQDGVGGLRGGFEYARTGNPTRSALERVLAAVEDGGFGRAFSSGHGGQRLRSAGGAASG